MRKESNTLSICCSHEEGEQYRIYLLYSHEEGEQYRIYLLYSHEEGEQYLIYLLDLWMFTVVRTGLVSHSWLYSYSAHPLPLPPLSLSGGRPWRIFGAVYARGTFFLIWVWTKVVVRGGGGGIQGVVYSTLYSTTLPLNIPQTFTQYHIWKNKCPHTLLNSEYLHVKQ